MRFPLLSVLLLPIAGIFAAPAPGPVQDPAVIALSAQLGIGISADPASVLGLPVLTLANRTDPDAGGRFILCETTKASARLHDIDRVIRFFEHYHDYWCRNVNRFGSKCTKVGSVVGLAAVSLCGAPFSMQCGEVAIIVRAIKDRCQWSMYSGGKDLMLGDRRIALHKN